MYRGKKVSLKKAGFLLCTLNLKKYTGKKGANDIFPALPSVLRFYVSKKCGFHRKNAVLLLFWAEVTPFMRGKKGAQCIQREKGKDNFGK